MEMSLRVGVWWLGDVRVSRVGEGGDSLYQKESFFFVCCRNHERIRSVFLLISWI